MQTLAEPAGSPGLQDDHVAPEALAQGPRPMAFHILFVVGGGFLAINLLFGLYAGFMQIFLPGSETAQQFQENLGATSTSQLFWYTALNLLMFAIIPLAWVYGTRVRPWLGGNRYLGLHSFLPAAGRGALLGIGLAFAILLTSILWILATEGIDGVTAEPNGTSNPVVEGIVANLNLPLVLFISFAAGFGEEILFRGILQKWLGWWPQAIVFGLSHAVGGDPIQIGVTLLIGLLFGYLVHRKQSLWLVIAAHFTYDLVLLLAALYAT